VRAWASLRGRGAFNVGYAVSAIMRGCVPVTPDVLARGFVAGGGLLPQGVVCLDSLGDPIGVISPDVRALIFFFGGLALALSFPNSKPSSVPWSAICLQVGRIGLGVAVCLALPGPMFTHYSPGFESRDIRLG